MASKQPVFGTHPIDDDKDLEKAFAVLANAPHLLRADYAAQLRGLMRDELAAQAARRTRRPWWLAWQRRTPQATQPGPRTVRDAAPRRGPVGLRLAMTAVGAIVVLLVVTMLIARLYPLQLGGQVASVRVSAGEVEVVRLVRVLGDMGLTRRVTVAADERAQLRPGDELLSSREAEAEVAFSDGSKMAVGPGVQLTFEELQTRTVSKPLAIAMRLDRGEVRSQVEHLRADHDRFEISTPNLVAQVRGTVFRIDVRSEGTRVATDQGVVRVNWNGQTVDVEAGRELQMLLGASVPEVHVRPQSPDLVYNVPDAPADVNAQGERLLFTSSAVTPWRIRTLPGVKVSLFVDDEPVSSVISGSDGIADINLNLAQENTYRITAVMETLTGERSLPAPTQVVVIDRTSPSLLLTSPSEPQVVGESVRVAGRTEPGVRLTLNQLPITVGETGEFEYELPLTSGINEIILIATDRAGNGIKLQSVIVSESELR